MKGKSLVAAIIISFAALVSLLSYFYCNDMQLQRDRFGFMQSNENHLLVNFGSSIVWLNRQGDEVKALDLSAHGYTPVGDFAEFSNGDLLIYHRVTETGFFQNLASYLRLQRLEKSSAVDGEGFYRCKANGESCFPFATELPSLPGAFRLAIDKSDTIYLSDTRAFEIYRISSTGNIDAKTKQSFRFPNALVLRDDRLWVSDTNNYRIVAINTEIEKFGEELETLDIEFSGAHRWPHQLAFSEKGWWINLGDHALSDGRIIRFDGEQTHDIDHGLVDPMAIAYWQETLWLADFEYPRLLRINEFGNSQGGYNSETLVRLIAKSEALRERYSRLSLFSLVALALVFVGGLLAAWIIERKQTKTFFNAPFTLDLNSHERMPIAEGEVIWLTNTLAKKMHWLGKLILLLALSLPTAVLIITLPLFLEETGQVLSIWFMTLVLTGACLSLYWVLLHSSRWQLGVDDKFLYLKNKQDSFVTPWSKVCFHPTYLFCEPDISVAIGPHNNRYYEKTQLKGLVLSRLQEENRLKGLAVVEFLWKSRDPQFLLGAIIIGAGTFALIFSQIL